MLTTFINTLMSAEADAVCDAEYGARSAERSNTRNGYRPREFDTRAGTLEVAIPNDRRSGRLGRANPELYAGPRPRGRVPRARLPRGRRDGGQDSHERSGHDDAGLAEAEGDSVHGMPAAEERVGGFCGETNPDPGILSPRLHPACCER